jgi:NADPH2:quinone reductase
MAFGEPEDLVLQEIELPAPGPGEVRVRLRAAGLNFADGLVIAGKYQLKPALPFTPGLEGAGEIVEVGQGVDDLRIGRRVAVLVRPGGCYATEIVAKAEAVTPLPDGTDDVAAACLPVTYGTAHLALGYRGGLRPGETLLVTGAAGGVGIAALEIGKALGARVIAAARGADRLEIARAHGADEVIDYAAEDLRDRVKALTEGRGADVVFEAVGGDVFDRCVRAVAWEGRLLVIGFASGRIPSVPANLVLVKNFSVIGVDFGAHMDRHAASMRGAIGELLAWHAAGRLKPRVSATYRLEEAARALRELMARRATGKTALVMD